MTAAGTHNEVALWRAVAMMNSRINEELERSLQSAAGISRAEYDVLSALAADAGARARSGDLADMLTWEKSRVSHLVTRMVARGFLEREYCDTDLRGTWVRMAPAGRSALEAAMPSYTQTVRSAFADHLSTEESATVGAVAIRVAENLAPSSCEGAVAHLKSSIAPSAASSLRS